MSRTFEQLKTDLETLFAVGEQFTAKFNSFDAELSALPTASLARATISNGRAGVSMPHVEQEKSPTHPQQVGCIRSNVGLR